MMFFLIHWLSIIQMNVFFRQSGVLIIHKNPKLLNKNFECRFKIPEEWVWILNFTDKSFLSLFKLFFFFTVNAYYLHE